MRFRLVSVGLVVVCASSALTISSAAAQSAQAMAQNCFVCHGPGALGSDPLVRLAGQPKELLERQLVDFKSDRRPATIMSRIAKGYSDEQLATIADYLSKLPR